MNQQNARVLVLPRPNLGPEPWSEERQTPWPLITVGLMFAALLAGAGLFALITHGRQRWVGTGI